MEGPDEVELPEDPRLRELAIVLERHGISFELLDPKWRIVYTSSQILEILDLQQADTAAYYGRSMVVRNAERAHQWGTSPESGRRWWSAVGGSMRHDVPPEDPDFAAVFGDLAPVAERLPPANPPPAAIAIAQDFPDVPGMRQAWIGRVRFLYLRLHDRDGTFFGVLAHSRGDIREALALRLSRGREDMFARMDAIREPVRRPAAVLFADLEASGRLSRTLPSRAYFELIRALTDLIDAEVGRHGGIIGKHAGDGASALFVVERGAGESRTARAAIEAARGIRAGARELLPGGPEVRVNVGLHWGATLTIGQVSTTGRLEVTALGDEMNEAARIECAARGGAALASKDLVERLDAEDAAALALDPGRLVFQAIADLGTVDDKVLRDAGTIAVVEI